MSVEAALIIASFILMATLAGIIIFVATRRQKAKDDELWRAASARGWTFEATSHRNCRILRWTGATDGIPWQAESLVQTSGGRHGQRRRLARWHGAWSPGVTSPIVAVGLPKGKEDNHTVVGEGEGVFARMAQKVAGFAFDKSIDGYFGDGPGKEVDAAAMRRVAVKVPGFVIMATDPHEGARVMQRGLESALLSAAGDKSLVLSNGHRPWILLRPQAVSVARMERVSDINDLEGLVRAGVALTRAFKFGRPVKRSG